MMTVRPRRKVKRSARVSTSSSLAVLLTLAALLLVGTGARVEGVKMYSLQRGMKVPSTEVFLRYNLTGNRPPLAAFTVCYWFRLERFNDLTPHFSYAISDADSNRLLIGNELYELKSYINGKVQAQVKGKFEVFPEMWTHLCHLVDAATYTIFRQGQVFSKRALEGTADLPLNGTLIIGQEQDRYSGGFHRRQVLHGDIAQIGIWDYILPESSVAELAACRRESQGNVFNLDSEDVEVFGDVQLLTVDLDYFCRSSHHFVILAQEQAFPPSRTICRLLNSSLPVPHSQEDNERLKDEFTPFMNVCSPGSIYKLWLGIRDAVEEGTWVDGETSEPVTFANFQPSYPNGGLLYSCALMLEYGTWADASCTTKICGACTLERSDFLFLRGLCFDEEHRTYLRFDGYVENRPLFRGYYNYVIVWQSAENRWLLQDINNEMTLAWLLLIGENVYPIGYHTWTATEAICGKPKATEIPLSISSCANDQFMCKSGHCIDHAYRCNLRYNCNDGSDEDECDIVVVNSAYRRHLPPRGHKDTTLELVPALVLTRVASVDDMNMVLDLEFVIAQTWSDNRLLFRHLHVANKTLIPEREVSKIWTPRIQILNVESGQIKVLDSSVVITTARNSTLPNYNDVDRDLQYPGADNPITLSSQYAGTFTCSFDLYVYPFDVQLCSVDLGLPWDDGSIQFTEIGGRAEYIGPEDLSLYTVKHSALEVKPGGTRIRLKFELHRRSGMVLISTFLPALLLLAVSWATLFVKLELLQVRAIMSLTTLLVLYTLFSNFSRTMPNTAAIKLIDMWFFCVIVLLFLNIMVHIFIDVISVISKSKVTEVLPVGLKIPMVTDSSKKERIMMFYRIFISPFLFLSFNLVLGLMAFLG